MTVLQQFLNISKMQHNLFNSLKAMKTSAILDILAALFFIIGLMVIYAPQYRKLYVKKTSLGFSPWFMFLGHTASLLSCANTTIFYIDGWWKCRGFGGCTEGFMGLIIVIFQWIFYWIQYTILVYYEYFESKNDIQYHLHNKHKCLPNSLMKTTFITSNLISLIGIGITFYLLAKNNWHHQGSVSLEIWSNCLDIFISICFFLHYLPQLYETYYLKQVGSMSLISLAIMCPGTFLWTGFLAYQSKITNNPSAGNIAVWLPYLFVGSMQAILLGMGYYYEKLMQQQKRFNEHLIAQIDYDADNYVVGDV